ncbi:hypothetical protein FRC08_006141 [Ceratobasidium sp. 394]|nr:hypothetical protein FRC08_006141 [Ceratobasidium sp. 394]
MPQHGEIEFNYYVLDDTHDKLFSVLTSPKTKVGWLIAAIKKALSRHKPAANYGNWFYTRSTSRPMAYQTPRSRYRNHLHGLPTPWSATGNMLI